jgi:pimeloyl-ACP methyl ester carboxylesterase
VSTLRSLQLPERVRSGWLTTPRGKFAILEAQPARGVADRRPALLVHGYTGSKENFLPVLEPLAAAGRMVVAVDLRGQYQSPHAPDRSGYSATALAADVLAIAAAVADDSAGVHLVGHSMGGLIAREAVLLQRGASGGIPPEFQERRASGHGGLGSPQGTPCPPELQQFPRDQRNAFLSLTLLGSGPGMIAGSRAEDLRRVLALLDPADGAVPDDVPRLAELIRLSWHDKHEPLARAEGVEEHIIAFLRERTLRTCPVSLIVMARYLLSCPDRTAELAEAVSAGLAAAVVYGEFDDAWPPAEQDLMAVRLGAERTCIAGAAHSPAIEAPVTTASTLTEFWNAAERRQPILHTCGRPASKPAAAAS